MAKKKEVKKKPDRPKTYEKSSLAISGSLDQVLKISIAQVKKQEKK